MSPSAQLPEAEEPAHTAVQIPWRKWAAEQIQPFPSIRHYRSRWLPKDLLAGITFGAITIPGQLATAHLAGMPPITGVYGFIVACLFGAFISSNRHLALGVDSTVAPLLAAGVAAVAAAGSPEYLGYVAVTTMLVGLFIFIIGAADMGWVGDLLPKPVITGFLGGIAIIIVINQLPGLTGTQSASGPVLLRLGQVASHLPQARLDATLIGLVSLAALLTVPRLLPKFPTALLVLVAATVVSTTLGLAAKGVAVLGALPSGLPPIHWPPLSLSAVTLVLPTALGIAIICLAQTAATARTVAAIGGFEADVARDYRALGAANIASSLVGSFTLDASPPSSTILSNSRARSQVAALTAAALGLVLILAASGLLANLPMSVLSAILIYIATKIFQLDQMRSMLRYSWNSFSLMLITMIGVLVLGIELGLALAVLIAFIYRGRRIARPELVELGRNSETGEWWPVTDKGCAPVPGVGAHRLNGPLWFGNADWFRQYLLGEIGDGPDKVNLLVLDGTRMDDVDYTGVDALKSIQEVCQLRDVTFAIAVHGGRTAEALRRGGIYRRVGKEHFFSSVSAAVEGEDPEALEQSSDV